MRLDSKPATGSVNETSESTGSHDGDIRSAFGSAADADADGPASARSDMTGDSLPWLCALLIFAATIPLLSLIGDVEAELGNLGAILKLGYTISDGEVGWWLTRAEAALGIAVSGEDYVSTGMLASAYYRADGLGHDLDD